VSEQEYREKEAQQRAARHRLEQARAERHARRARGTLEAEAELAKRAKELADTRAALALLELGNRAEEIEAERARLARLAEEVRYLEGLRDRVRVISPVGGLVATPHLREKVGQYLHEGELIGVVEEPAGLEAEIALAEQDAVRVRPGQRVELKARALPFETRTAQVDRIATAAERGDAQSTVTVYCRVPSPLSPRRRGVGGEGEAAPGLRSEMTGYARIYTGRRRVGEILIDRVLRFIRTEFWW
jgi:multidrug resistance efflux pump